MVEIPSDLDEKYHDIYDSMTGLGRSPKVVLACIEYIETEKTQAEAADEYGVSSVAVSQNYKLVFDNSDIEGVAGSGGPDVNTIQEDVFDAVGLDESHYSGDPPKYTVNKLGWLALRRHVTEDGH